VPIPLDIQHATEDFERFLARVKEETGLTTRNQAYTTVQGVFLTFRRRLTVTQGLAFAQVLPPVARALFIAGWTPEDPMSFAEREILTREVRALRRDHNFSPDTAIADVARALRFVVDEAALDRVLADCPEGAAAYWDGTARTM
jgi:uncharacterized protein (DUF2267 family)